MIDFAGTDHIEVDIDQATYQMIISFNCRCEIPIFPKRPSPPLSAVVLLSGTCSDQLHASSNTTPFRFPDEQVNMVAGYDEIKNGKAVACSGFKQPVTPANPIAFEFQQKFAIMASMSDVSDELWNVKTVGPGH